MTAAAQKFDQERVTRLLLDENCPDELDLGAYASSGPAADIENRALDWRNHRRPLRKGWVALPSAQMDLLLSKLQTCTNVTKVDFSGKTALMPLAALSRLGWLCFCTAGQISYAAMFC